jgi:hypothetical protein
LTLSNYSGECKKMGSSENQTHQIAPESTIGPQGRVKAPFKIVLYKIVGFFRKPR